MAFIEAGGLCAANSTSEAKGSLQQGGAANSSSAVLCLALGNLTLAPPAISMAQSLCLAQFVQEVKVTDIAAITSTKVRVTFDRGMLNNTALKNVGNYSISPQTPGAANLYLSSVEPENKTYPTFVDIITSEMTDGAMYQGMVSSYGPIDPEGVPVDANNNTYSYVGSGDLPTISQVIAISKNRVDVVFTENMKDNPDIRNPENYEFDNGLITLEVLDMEADTVKLVTTDQTPGVLYTLIIKEIKRVFFGSPVPFGSTPAYYETFDKDDWSTLVKFSASYNDLGGLVESFEEQADEYADAWNVPFPGMPAPFASADPLTVGNWTRVKFDTVNTVEDFEGW